jgi:cystathionine gamma-synthase
MNRTTQSVSFETAAVAPVTGINGASTRAVHAGERWDQATDSLATPIHQTATYWFKDSATLQAYQEGRLQRDEYGRYGNPTWRAVERKVAQLENAEDAVLFASGMCAVTTTFIALLPRDAHLIITSDCYRRTRQFCREYLTRMGVETTVIEPSEVAMLREAVRPDTRLFFTELPTNPFLRVIDLPQAVRVAREKGVKVIVDSTFATPVHYRPICDGADLVIHSATKYFGGHNDLLAGIVAGNHQDCEVIRKALGILGGIAAPQNAYLLLRGLKTLSLRMARHGENAVAIARMLERHPKIRRVYYPGLQSHPDHEVAARLLSGFGGVVTFEIEGDIDGATRFIDACRIPYIAPSLGGVESLIEMPAIMSYWDLSPGERRRQGISDSLVRYACGIEDTQDLLDDLEQALKVV